MYNQLLHLLYLHFVNLQFVLKFVVLYYLLFVLKFLLLKFVLHHLHKLLFYLMLHLLFHLLLPLQIRLLHSICHFLVFLHLLFYLFCLYYLHCVVLSIMDLQHRQFLHLDVLHGFLGHLYQLLLFLLNCYYLIGLLLPQQGMTLSLPHCIQFHFLFLG